MLISVISVIVFVASRLPVLLVTSRRRRVMDRRVPGGLKKNNIAGFSLAAAGCGAGPPRDCPPA